MRKMSHLFWFLFKCQEKSIPRRPQPFQCYIQPPKLFNKQQYSKPKSNPATYPNPHNRKTSTVQTEKQHSLPWLPIHLRQPWVPQKAGKFLCKPWRLTEDFQTEGELDYRAIGPLGKSPASSSLPFMPWEVASISATATETTSYGEGIPCWCGELLNDLVQ